jgi:hypothetical protein
VVLVSMPIIEYHYDDEFIDRAEQSIIHTRVLAILPKLRNYRKISDFKLLEHKQAFPTEEVRKRFLEKLADFSLVHHVALARIFGSRKYGFSNLPIQFIVVYADSAIKEVFPCRIGQNEVGIIEYLEALEEGRPWTKGVQSKKDGAHEKIVEAIIGQPAELEQGLSFINRDVQVGQSISDIGFIDVVFKDSKGSYLVVEVKPQPTELDEAIGKILRHRKLFADQNNLEEKRVRAGIVCPHFSDSHRTICQEIGIEVFVISR